MNLHQKIVAFQAQLAMLSDYADVWSGGVHPGGGRLQLVAFAWQMRHSSNSGCGGALALVGAMMAQDFVGTVCATGWWQR